MMRGQSLKTRDQRPFSETSPVTELLPETGAEHCYDFIALRFVKRFSIIPAQFLVMHLNVGMYFVSCRVKSIT